MIPLEKIHAKVSPSERVIHDPFTFRVNRLMSVLEKILRAFSDITSVERVEFDAMELSLLSYEDKLLYTPKLIELSKKTVAKIKDFFKDDGVAPSLVAHTLDVEEQYEFLTYGKSLLRSLHWTAIGTVEEAVSSPGAFRDPDTLEPLPTSFQLARLRDVAFTVKDDSEPIADYLELFSLVLNSREYKERRNLAFVRVPLSGPGGEPARVRELENRLQTYVLMMS